ncbi:hypothetical protein PCANC_26044 [Puccinia coronata f. sp. avenae]|uniref:Uncharacterized protein n=1 Tax=Puccinia coronata f. sp. avenae TaxID=200324 RepID=A0A2N5SE74_9BASI|nr:hypothetical protein PCANC_26044 [Puccinia coronata f. sp. avenae]
MQRPQRICYFQSPLNFFPARIVSGHEFVFLSEINDRPHDYHMIAIPRSGQCQSVCSGLKLFRQSLKTFPVNVYREPLDIGWFSRIK